MSRIGRKPVAVPAGVKVAVNGRVVSAEGPKGKLEWEFRPGDPRGTRRRGQDADRLPRQRRSAWPAPCTA